MICSHWLCFKMLETVQGFYSKIRVHIECPPSIHPTNQPTICSLHHNTKQFNMYLIWYLILVFILILNPIQLSGNARGAKIRSILSSIIHSETIYVECLNKMLQVRAIKISDRNDYTLYWRWNDDIRVICWFLQNKKI